MKQALQLMPYPSVRRRIRQGNVQVSGLAWAASRVSPQPPGELIRQLGLGYQLPDGTMFLSPGDEVGYLRFPVDHAIRQRLTPLRSQRAGGALPDPPLHALWTGSGLSRASGVVEYLLARTPLPAGAEAGRLDAAGRFIAAARLTAAGWERT